jgi:ParB/RepB/Spo0J family partition protein
MSKKTKWKEGEQRVALTDCEPNDWNMNEMAPEDYNKLKTVVAETLEEAERIPPICVRPHPKKADKLQIVDGFHRWKVMQDLGYEEIDVVVLFLSDKRAMAMTAELNYVRGTPNMEKYPEYLGRMIREHSVDTQWLSERLPESKAEIENYLATAAIEIEIITPPSDDDEGVTAETKEASDIDALFEMKFNIRQGAAEVVERELARIGKLLGGGKNIRGRALEMMAALSMLTPAESITGALEAKTEAAVEEEEETPPPKKVSKKFDLSEASKPTPPGKTKKGKDALKEKARA